MPAAINFVIAKVAVWVASTMLSAGFSAAAAAATMNFIIYNGMRFIVMAALIAGSTAYNRAQMKKAMASLNASLDTSRNLSVKEPAATRKIVYGTTRIGGTVVYMATSGATNEYLHLVVCHAGHQCSSIDGYWLGDDVVTIDGSGNVTSGKYAGLCRIKPHLGADSQTVDTDLSSEVAEWTSTHRLRGVCYTYWRLKHSPDVFVSGLPNPSVLLSGKLVYDPRSATTAWSNNPALCIRDYLMDASLGLGALSAEVDNAAVITAANICDELVNLNPSGTEKRYTCNGIIDTAGQPGGIINELLSSMAGICPYVSGKFTMRAGAHTAAVLTLTEDDLTGPISVSCGDPLSECFNGVKGVYVSSKNNYQPSDFPPVVNSTYTTEDGGVRVWKDIQLPFTDSSATAQRLAKIELERSRQDITVDFPCKLTALNVCAGEVVALTIARYGWSSKLFEVVQWGFSATDDQPPTLGIKMVLRETAAGVWDWASGEETTVDLAPNSTLRDYRTVLTPAGLTLSTLSFFQPDGTNVPRLKVVWNSPGDVAILQGGRAQVEYKKTADSTWLIWNPYCRGDATEEYILDVQANVAYDVRVRFENIRGVSGPYATQTNYTVAKDTTAPAAPTGLSVVVGTGKSLALKWTANTEVDLFEYGIWRYTSNTPASAVKIAETRSTTYVDTAVTPGQIYYYWVTAIDASENESSKSATPASGTPVGAAPLPVTLVAGANVQLTGSDSAQKVSGSNTAWDAGLYGSESYSNGCQLTFRSGNPSALCGCGITTNNPASSNGYSDISNWIFVSATSVDVYENGSFVQNIYGAGIPATALFSITYDGLWIRYAIDGVVYRRVLATTGLGFKMDASFYTVNAVLQDIKFSPMGQATGGVNSSPATNPGAATLNSSGVYNSGDGTVLSYLNINVPALPTSPIGAAYQNLLYRKTGGSADWMVGAQLTNTSATTIRLDDLSPGVAYDVALQAFSQFDIPSSVVAATSSPFTAPTKSSASANPTGVAAYAPSSSNLVKLVMDSGYRMYSGTIKWTDSTDKDVIGYEFGISGTAATPPSSVAFYVPQGTGKYQYDTYTLSAQYLWYRTRNSSGIAGTWTDSGYNMNGYVAIPANDMVEQSSTDVKVSGIKTGAAAASSVRQVVARFQTTAVATLAGGALTEEFSVSLTNRGFTTKPDIGIVGVSSDPNIKADYNWDNASNSSTVAYVRCTTLDGTNLPNAAVRFNIEFIQYA